MRLFFAVEVPDKVVERILEAQAGLRRQIGDDGVRWTRPDQFHFTLRFLGEQPPLRMARAVKAAVETRTGRGPFQMAVGGLGAFPSRERPSVLWTAATEGAGSLGELAGVLDHFLQRERFPRENRPFKAHLTLARIKGYAGEESAARALRTVTVGDLGSFRVDGFVLMESKTLSSGSQYRVVERFELRS